MAYLNELPKARPISRTVIRSLEIELIKELDVLVAPPITSYNSLSVKIIYYTLMDGSSHQ